MSAESVHGRLTVAILDEFELVQQGLSKMCEAYSDRVRIVTASAAEPMRPDVDLALIDNLGPASHHLPVLRHSLPGVPTPKLVVYSWNVHPELVDRAFEEGAHGYLAKSLRGGDLVSALERIYAGERVVSSAAQALTRVNNGEYHGQGQGLTQREAEIIALITQGLSNQQIADRSYLSINSVKSYIRSCYRKIGVSSRSQAVLWGIGHGFRPDGFRVAIPSPER